MKSVLNYLLKGVLKLCAVVFIAFLVTYLVICAIIALPFILILIIIVAVQDNENGYRIVP